MDACRVFGVENVTETEPTMGGEDFAFYTQKIPGAMIFLGQGDPATNFPLHSPNFLLEERVLPLGSRLLAELAVEYINNGGFQTPVDLSAESTEAASASKAAGTVVDPEVRGEL